MTNLTIEPHKTEDLNAAQRATPMLTYVHGLFRELAAQHGSELPALHVLITADLPGAVRQIKGEDNFTGERIGGTVVGKTIRSDPQWLAATIYLNSWQWPEEAGDQWMPYSILTVSHEFAHAMLGGLRHGEPGPDVGDEHVFAKAARRIPLYAVDEFRADWLANLILSATASTTDAKGDARPTTSVDVLGEVYLPEFERALDQVVHPGWPDLVERYRHRQLGLDPMLDALVSQTDQVITLLGHAHAEAAISDTERPIERFAQHPAVDCYLGPVWRPIIEYLQGSPLMGSPDELVAADMAIGEIGREAVTEMWAGLGVTVRSDGDALTVDVAEPMR